MKKVELHGYLVFLDDAYRADPPGPDGKPTGRFRLAGRDRELRVFTEQVRQLPLSKPFISQAARIRARTYTCPHSARTRR